jgi:small neutral amino acid transporter SnatA (MarC family)
MHTANCNDMHAGVALTCEMGAHSCAESVMPTSSKHTTVCAIISEQEQAHQKQNMFFMIYCCILCVFTLCMLVFNMSGRHVVTCTI